MGKSMMSRLISMDQVRLVCMLSLLLGFLCAPAAANRKFLVQFPEEQEKLLFRYYFN